MKSKPNIRELSKDEVIDFFTKSGEAAFRGKQVFEWLWKKSAHGFDEMTNLSKPLREKLEEHFDFPALSVKTSQKSKDGTIKCAFELDDSQVVEGVLIPTEDRVTACISSQVGCSLACSFCATGFMDLKRNLRPDEIYDQVVLLEKESLTNYDRPLTNIVFMGMGEPLLNYKNVLAGIDHVTSEEGLGKSPRRITVSTAGIVKQIKKLGDDEVKFNFALSLHAANDEKRNKIMAINESNSLANLVEAINYLYSKTKARITFEYILFDGFNDTLNDARELVELCRKVPAKVNLIEYNQVEGVAFSKSRRSQREQFVKFLEDHRVTATVRTSRGEDIDAACGQLANKH